MELQYRLIRQAIDIAVSKGIEDIKDNTKRGLRNLIDLGLFFSQSENQKWFFTTAQKVITNPRNPYNSLAKAMISEVDNETIKRVGLNLGYGSLTYGAHKLKKKQEDLGVQIPWLLILDISASSPDLFHRMEQCIQECQEMGIYSYIACPSKKDDIPVLCETAKRFEECMFALKVPPGFISEQTATSLGKIHNTIVSVQAPDTGFNCEKDINAFRLLRRNHCLYGFHIYYNEENMKQVTAPEYIRSAINLGNLFGVYIAQEGVSDICKDKLYEFVCRERGENGQPLITLEWPRDMRDISQKILSGDGYMAINLAEKVYFECPKAKNSLLEIFQNMQPCTSS